MFVLQLRAVKIAGNWLGLLKSPGRCERGEVTGARAKSWLPATAAWPSRKFLKIEVFPVETLTQTELPRGRPPARAAFPNARPGCKPSPAGAATGPPRGPGHEASPRGPLDLLPPLLPPPNPNPVPVFPPSQPAGLGWRPRSRCRNLVCVRAERARGARWPPRPRFCSLAAPLSAPSGDLGDKFWGLGLLSSSLCRLHPVEGPLGGRRRR